MSSDLTREDHLRINALALACGSQLPDPSFAMTSNLLIARAEAFCTFLSARADADAKGTDDDQQGHHDENRDDDNGNRGVAAVAMTAAAWRDGSHRVTVPEVILTETVKLLEGEGLGLAASRLLGSAVSEKRSRS